MSRVYDCDDPSERTEGIRAACTALRRGKLVVIPTDTVYGIAGDAFRIGAAVALLAAKNRGRDMPIPVLVASPATLDGIAEKIPASGRQLIEAFWPGGLTVVCREQPSLVWDLGDAEGTVAVRMPLHPVALEILREIGPLAVSSANITGYPPAATAEQAREQFGDAVEVYLEGGVSDDLVPSSIVDLTGETPTLLREGAVSLELLRSVVPELRAPNDADDHDDAAEPRDVGSTEGPRP